MRENRTNSIQLVGGFKPKCISNYNDCKQTHAELKNRF